MCSVSLSTVMPLGGSSTPKERRDNHTGPVHVSFPSWTLHSGWHGIHSPAWVANSRLSLHSGRKVIFLIFYLLISFKSFSYTTANITHIKANTVIIIVIHIISCFAKTDPVKNMQSGTHIPPLLYFLQDRHWFGPGPQQPSEEHRGSHTWPSLTTDINRNFF